MPDLSPEFRLWTASDGYKAYYRRWLPQGTPRAHLVCLHGIQSHGGWYEHSSSRFCEAGYAVHYLDRRGSGMNHEARGDAPGFRRLLFDCGEFSAHLRLDNPKIPVVFVACSWGGKLATALCRRFPHALSALVLMCPGIFPKVRPGFFTRLGIFFSRLVVPQANFDIPLNEPELFTATPQWREFIAKDPLALHRATARLLVESVRLDIYLKFVPIHVRHPTLLMLAEHDRIINNGRTRAFVQRFATSDKTILEYPGTHHTLEFEPDPEFFIADAIQWLNKRYPAR